MKFFPNALIKSSNSPIAKNMGWNVFGNITAKVIGPVLQIIIARMLMPEDYGVFGVAMALIAFFDVVKDLGLTQAIIVHQGDDDDISIQFTSQFVLSLIIYFIILAGAQFVASFYSDNIYNYIMPILGLTLFCNSFIDPFITYYMKAQNYKLIAIRQIIAPLLIGTVGLCMAYFEYGVYALVFGTLSGQIGVMIFLLYKAPVKIRFNWNYARFLELFILGKEIIVQKFSGFLVQQADSLVIGKKLESSNLGIYRMGQRLVNLLPTALVYQIQQVLFTDLARHSKDINYIERRYYQFVYIAGVLLALYIVSLYYLAPVLVPIILGNQWHSLIPVMQVISVGVVSGYICGLNNEISKILGFARIYSYYTIFRSVVTITGVCIAVNFSLKHVIVTWVAIGMIANVVNEILFYYCQSIVKIRLMKVVLYLSVWIWASVIIYQYCMS